MTKADNAWNRGIPLERRAEERCPEEFADGYDMGVEDTEELMIKLLDSPEFRLALLSAARHFVGLDYDPVAWGLAKAKAKAEAIAMIRGL